jgi:hypothetical protein
MKNVLVWLLLAASLLAENRVGIWVDLRPGQTVYPVRLASKTKSTDAYLVTVRFIRHGKTAVEQQTKFALRAKPNYTPAETDGFIDPDTKLEFDIGPCVLKSVLVQEIRFDVTNSEEF